MENFQFLIVDAVKFNLINKTGYYVITTCVQVQSVHFSIHVLTNFELWEIVLWVIWNHTFV